MKTTMRRQRHLLCCAICAILFDPALHAATLRVDSADDDAIATACNLRAALASIDAGAATAACTAASSGVFGSDDSVEFAANLVGATITLQQGQLALHKPATLHGSGQTIDANHRSRVLYFNGATLAASDLTLTHGNASGATAADGQGGALDASAAALSLTRVQIVANAAAGDGGGIRFGGANAALTLDDVQIRDNTSAGRGGGVAFFGNAARIERSVISGNSGDRAGGLMVHYAAAGIDVAIRSSTLSGNSVSCGTAYCGGALYIAGLGRLYVGASTFSGNQVSGAAHYVAGAIYAYGTAATLVNSTIANNTASGAGFVAGGLWELHGANYAKGGLALLQCTVSANAAASSDAGGVSGGGIVAGAQAPAPSVRFRGSVDVANSIVAGNLPDNDLNTQSLSPGTVLTARYSVLGPRAQSSPFDDPANHNVFADTPGLGNLQINGGPTATLALLAASPARDVGSPALAQVGGVPLAYDQRGTGFLRFDGASVDAGALQDQRDRVFGDGFE